MAQNILLSNNDLHGLLLDLLAVRVQRLNDALEDDSLEDNIYAKIMGESWMLQNALDLLKETGPIPSERVIQHAHDISDESESAFREAEYPDEVLSSAQQGVANGLLYVVDSISGIDVFIAHYFELLKED